MIPTDTSPDPICPPRAGQLIVIYDGDCGFCKWLLAGLLAWDRGPRLRPLPLGTPDADALLADLTPAQRAASWHLVAPDGSRLSGGAALPALLRELPAGAPPAALFAAIPGPTDRGYRWVAAHRVGLSRLVPAPLKRRAAEQVSRAQEAANSRS